MSSPDTLHLAMKEGFSPNSSCGAGVGLRERVTEALVVMLTAMPTKGNGCSRA